MDTLLQPNLGRNGQIVGHGRLCVEGVVSVDQRRCAIPGGIVLPGLTTREVQGHIDIGLAPEGYGEIVFPLQQLLIRSLGCIDIPVVPLDHMVVIRFCLVEDMYIFLAPPVAVYAQWQRVVHIAACQRYRYRFSICVHIAFHQQPISNGFSLMNLGILHPLSLVFHRFHNLLIEAHQ